MCGIAGYYGNLNKEVIERMLRVQNHRGPDDKGYALFNNGKVGISNNRLAIIDLSPKGHQPMYYADKKLCIVFNGEIYNFMEVRRELEKMNYVFESKSDTEVILAAYAEWGVDCLQKLNGMFSLVIFDSSKNLLFGARDRLGEKPLKYYYDGKDFIFASEVKTILSALPKTPDIDFEAINHYLTLMYVPVPMTGFKNMYKLPPAHYFLYDGTKLEIKKYWQLDYKTKANKSESEWADLILQELERSVKMRMISDVPIGALLSGGVDSSAVVAYMAKNSPGKVRTYSIGMNVKEFDETNYSNKIAQMYDTTHTVLHVDAQMLLDLMPKLVEHYDEPFADNSMLPTFLVTKLARQHITVALDGDGGDENFAGYDRYKIVQFAQNVLVQKLLLGSRLPRDLAYLTHAFVGSKFSERLCRFITTFSNATPERLQNYNCFFTNLEKFGLYTNEFADSVRQLDSFKLFESFYDVELNDLDNALQTDIYTYLPEDLLNKTDIASMANSLELRAPLLDHKLMEMTARIPSELKIKNGQTKYIFKKALVDKGILPASLVYRKKRGFNIPLGRWLKNDLKQSVRSTILSGTLSKFGIFDEAKLTAYVDRYYSTNLSYDNNMYALFMLTNWLDKYHGGRVHA